MSNEKSLFQRAKFFVGGSLLLIVVLALGLSVLFAAHTVRLYNSFNKVIDHYF